MLLACIICMKRKAFAIAAMARAAWYQSSLCIVRSQGFSYHWSRLTSYTGYNYLSRVPDHESFSIDLLPLLV